MTLLVQTPFRFYAVQKAEFPFFPWVENIQWITECNDDGCSLFAHLPNVVRILLWSSSNANRRKLSKTSFSIKFTGLKMALLEGYFWLVIQLFCINFFAWETLSLDVMYQCLRFRFRFKTRLRAGLNIKTSSMSKVIFQAVFLLDCYACWLQFAVTSTLDG